MLLSRGPKGQNLVEYILLVVAVVIVMIVFLRKNGFYHNSVKGTIESGTLMMLKNAEKEIEIP